MEVPPDVVTFIVNEQPPEGVYAKEPEDVGVPFPIKRIVCAPIAVNAPLPEKLMPFALLVLTV